MNIKAILFTGNNNNLEIEKNCDYIFMPPHQYCIYSRNAYHYGSEICLKVENEFIKSL